MKSKKIVIGTFILFTTILLIGQALAITGSIGNARMILRAETGDVIDKYILVRNVNDEALNIELAAIGDLGKDITILDEKFVLEGGEEKKAQFKIKVRNVGTTQGKINVMFSPIVKGNGVGLSSTIIVIAEKGPGFFDFGRGDDENEDDDEKLNGGDKDENDGGVGVMTGKALSPIIKDKNNQGNKVLVFLGSLTIIIFIVFLGLLMYKNNLEKDEVKSKTKDKTKRGNSKSKKKDQVYE